MSDRMAGRRLWRAGVLACFLAAIVSGPAAAATPKPITIAVDPASGPPGVHVAISGSGYAAGTAYGLCILPAGKTKCGYEGANLIGGASAEQFTAAADGTIPAGTTGGIPDLVAGSYTIVSTAPGTGAIVASTPFSVTAPSMALAPTAGASGTMVAVTVTGAAPSTAYTICLAAQGSPSCGGVGVLLGDFMADASGAFPAGTTIRIPGQVAATYEIGLYLANANNTFIAQQTFTVSAPTLTLGASTGQAGVAVAASGSGYVPGAVYVLCMAGAADASCGGGMVIASFTADASGSIPAGIAGTLPAREQGSYRIGVMLDQSTPWYLASVPFELLAGTAPPASAPPTATPAPSQAAATPAPSAAPAGSESGAGGFPLILIAILVLVVLAVAFWYSRRRREPAKPGG